MLRDVVTRVHIGQKRMSCTVEVLFGYYLTHSPPLLHATSGPALLAAKRVIQHVGGKLLLFQSTLPTIGEGALKMRDNPRLLGSDKEHTMLNAEDA
jgi:hypothetical protein